MMNNSQHYRVVVALEDAQKVARNTLYASPEGLDAAARMTQLCAGLLWDQLTADERTTAANTDTVTICPPICGEPPTDVDLYCQAKYLTRYLWRAAQTRRDVLRREVNA